jgi:hypothetical protein
VSRSTKPWLTHETKAMIRTLVPINPFEQCILNMSLIHLCNQASYLGQAVRRLNNPWGENDEPTGDPWRRLHQITLHCPHPDQEYEGITLEAGLTQGYNLEVKHIDDRSQVPYRIPVGGQFVVVMRQKAVNAGFTIAATGIFVRPLALLQLDLILDMTTAESQAIVVRHPIIRDYPRDWQEQLQQFLNHTRLYEALPTLVASVDQTLNPDYRCPNWAEISLAAKGFAGV